METRTDHDAALLRAVETTGNARHRAARWIALVGLATAALALAGLIAWLLYQRATWTAAFGYESADRATQTFAGRGLRLLTAHEHFVPGIAAAIGAVIAALVLVIAMIKRKRWAYLATAIGCALSIVPPWLLRNEVWDIEAGFARSAKWAARSPYVAAATNLTIAATVVLAAIAVAASVTFLTAPATRRPQTPGPR